MALLTNATISPNFRCWNGKQHRNHQHCRHRRRHHCGHHRLHHCRHRRRHHRLHPHHCRFLSV